MNSRRSPRSAHKQPILSDPPAAPPPPPAIPSTYRARSPSSSSAASTSSVSSILQSTPTSKAMPLRTPTSHPSPGYQGYFDPYTSSSQQQQQHHPPPQQTTAQMVAAQAAIQASAAAAKKRTAPSPKSPPGPGGSSPNISAAAGAAANVVMPRSILEKHFDPSSSSVSLGNISASSSTATITPRDLLQSSPVSNSTSTSPQPPPAHQTSPTAHKKESTSKMNKLFSSARIVGTATSSTSDLKHGTKPPPSPSKIPHSIISHPIPRVTGSERKPSFSDKFNPSSSTITLVGAATATGSGIGVNIGGDVFSYAPPQAPYASSTYSSSPPRTEKEHSRTHFLRVRKEKDILPLSSASSNSKAVSLDGGSIYSFIPASPSTASHSKSSSSKAAAVGEDGISIRGKDSKDKHHTNLDDPTYIGTPEDWSFVRRSIISLFEGEPLRTPVEDMNKYIAAHIRRCKAMPHGKGLTVLLQDVTDILEGGMMCLDPGLQSVSDDRVLVGRLVEVWGFAWRSVLPYWEAVMLPLRSDSKKPGDWGDAALGPTGEADLARLMDTRKLALVSFRDHFVLPLFGKLRIVFSKLQLDFSSDLPNATESVARVLQCISVLASILSGDEKQGMIDELAKTLKHNWLSRGRAGRNRRGFVPQKTRVVGGVV